MRDSISVIAMLVQKLTSVPKIAAGLVLLLFMQAAQAQVPGPPVPAKYKAVIRYRMPAPRDIHVALYDAMIDHLESLDFEFVPRRDKLPETDREDPTKNQIGGLVPGKNAVAILKNPSVASVMLVPENFALPDQPDQHVHVRMELASGIPPDRQRMLGEQLRNLLGLLGFREALGYDQHGHTKKPFTRLAGVIPAGKLDLLLRDVRMQPTGWFAPLIDTVDLPSPLRQMNPILITEVMPDPEPLKEIDLTPRPAAHLEKLSQELWTLAQQKEQENQVVRIQMFLIGNPSPADKNLQFNLRRASPNLQIEGRLGQVITGTTTVEQTTRLAMLPQVSAIRLTRGTRVDVDPDIKVAGDNARALELSGLTELHKKGFKGKGVRLAIVDYDFRGWEKLVKDGKLPANTRHIDLTGERDPDLNTAPLLGDPDAIGHGSQCALAANLAAPDAELTLIRIEGTDPHQVYDVVQYFRQDHLSESIRRRQDEIVADRAALHNRREEVLLERKKILEDFSDESENQRMYGFLGPVMGWIFSDRDYHYQRMRYQEKLEKALAGRYDRWVKLFETTQALKGIHLAASAITWNDGHPMGSASPLSRWFHEQSFAPIRASAGKKDPGKLLWFQAAGNTRGQAWTGYFRDTDSNGVMEFAPPETPRKPGRWTHELNFLGWQIHEGGQIPELPLGARVRLSMQWREPHDPDYFTRLGEDDYYLQPLAELFLHVLRQRDPELKTLPADAFEQVGRSGRLPARLEHQPGHSTYEHSVEFTVDKASRYACRIERQLPVRWLIRDDPVRKRPTFLLLEDLVPTGLRPRGVATLTALEKNWELRLRLFVDVLDDANRSLGRVVLLDHFTDQGTLGMPADSRGVITVGAVDFAGKPLPSSAAGPPAFQELAGKPDLFAYSKLQVVPEGTATALGTSLASPFAAGWTACLMSAAYSREQIQRLLQERKVIRVPSEK